MQDFHIACVGIGGRGRSMIQWVQDTIDDVKITAVCDNDPDKFYAPFDNGNGMTPPLQQLFPDVRYYTDYDEMLAKEELDIVIVETPATCHTEFCVKALARNIHVYSDIPSVASLAEADALWKAGQASHAMLMTGATTCGWGFVHAMQDLYAKGLLGEPVYLEAEYIHDIRCLWQETPWRRKGQPIRYCTHSLGPLLRLLPDDDLRKVSCVTTGAHVVGEEGQNDLMTAHFTTPKNVVVRFTASFINEAKCGLHSYRVFGTEGYFERLSDRGHHPAHCMFNSKKLYGANKLTELPIDMQRPEFVDGARASCSGHGGADYVLFHDFFHALRSGDMSKVITMRDGIRMSLPGLFAAQSAEKGGEIVDIKYPWDND